MKIQGKLIGTCIIVMTVLIGIGTTGRRASANDYQSCFAPGDEIFSATFSTCVYQASNQEVRLHRITEMWSESVVTWDNAPSYDLSVEGSFAASSGCQTVDVTALVQAWISGTYENNGILLEQNQIGLAWYRSSEYIDDASLRPSLEICFTEFDCITIQRTGAEQDGVADAYIWALPAASNTNFGNSTHLNTGILNDYEKQALIRFELPPCLWTRTPGFWKNHPDVIDDTESCWNGGASLLPIDVCGKTLTATGGIQFSTSEAMSGPMGGWRTQLQLARQCTAAALNKAAMEAGGGSYGAAVNELIDECCGDAGVCGDEGASNRAIGYCVKNLNSFNNSGDDIMNAPFEGCYSGDSSESRAASKTATTIFNP